MDFKKHIKLTVLVLTGLLFAGEGDLLNQIVKAQTRKYEKIKDITIIQVHPEMGEMKIMRKGVKSRIEMNMPVDEDKTIPTIIVFDSLEYWMISPLIGRRKISSREAELYDEGKWWERGTQGRIVGEEKFKGTDCYIIEYKTDKTKETVKMWVSKNEYLLLKSETQEGKNSITTIYSDFRKVSEDLKMPFKIEIYEKGELEGTVIFKEIRINQGLSDDLFNVDKIEVKHLSPEELMEMMK